MDAAQREEVARRSVEAWNAENWEDQLRELWDPEGVIVSPPGWPESGEFQGWSAMVEQWRRLKSSWALEQVEVKELRSIGDRVLVDLRWSVRGELSGAPLEMDVSFVCDFKGDRLVRMEYFLDPEAARAAVAEKAP